MRGVHVSSGQLMVQGERVREFGVNTPDLLVNWLTTGSVTPRRPCPLTRKSEYLALFAELTDHGIRFVRFAPFGHRPATLNFGLLQDETRFLSGFDELVGSAEKHGVMLIPSLFFSISQLPSVLGEPLAAYDDESSRTSRKMAEIVELIVSRYKGSSAIGYWEFGNEYDAGMTIPPSRFLSTAPELGTPSEWSAADTAPFSMAHNATKRFHRLVRQFDRDPAYEQGPPRATASGNTGWRFARPHRSDWTRQVEDRVYDDQTETNTIHPYDNTGLYSPEFTGFAIYLHYLREELRHRGKPLIVGEFGVPRDPADRSTGVTPLFRSKLEQIVSAGIQLALLWNVPANRGTDARWSMRPDERRRADWELFAQFAREYRS